MYCTHCGVEFRAGQTFCAACGRAIPPLPPALSPDLGKHLRRLGVLWIVFSVWRLLGAGAMFVFGRFLLERFVPFHHGPAHLIPGILSALGVLLLAGALAGVAAGWGLLQHRSWARGLALILGVLALFDLPVGAALGIYTLWVLLPDRSAGEYRGLRSPA